MEITIQYFGAFRSFGEQLTLSLAKGAIVSDIRAALASALKQQNADFNQTALINSSRFATETEVLSEETPLQAKMVIVIIPPISGG